MHPLVEEMWTKGKALGLSLNEMSDEAGVQRQSLKRWVEKGVTPNEDSLKKVKALIKKFDNGEIEERTSEEQLPRQVIQEHWPEETKELYRLIYKLESKFGNLADVPEEDADLKKLHKHLERKQTRTRFSKTKLEKLRKEHQLLQTQMSKIAGRSPKWYDRFKGTRDFPKSYAVIFADYFGIALEELLIDAYEE